MARVRPLDTELVHLDDALGRILAESISAPIALPPWDNAAMDGYAVRGADLQGVDDGQRVRLTVVGEIPAGGSSSLTVGPGQAIRIFTGAPIPVGCDSVVRQEDTERDGDRSVVIMNARDCGRNIRPRGEDVMPGDHLFDAGAELGPAELGVLASIAANTISAHRRPQIAFLATGDEITTVDDTEAILAGRKIASSNSHTLAAAITLSGALPINLGIVGDDPAALRTRLDRGRTADLLLTTAGVSVGEHDHVRRVLHNMGLDMDFWRIRMRPGSPFGFGYLGDVPWMGLPGNPVSAMVTFELFVRPAIRRLAGQTRLFRRPVPVVAGEEITVPHRLCHFQRCRIVRRDDDALVAHLTGPQGSGLLTSMAKADALLIVPEDCDRVTPGDRLLALPLRGADYQKDSPY